MSNVSSPLPFPLYIYFHLEGGAVWFQSLCLYSLYERSRGKRTSRFFGGRGIGLYLPPLAQARPGCRAGELVTIIGDAGSSRQEVAGHGSNHVNFNPVGMLSRFPPCSLLDA